MPQAIASRVSSRDAGSFLLEHRPTQSRISLFEASARSYTHGGRRWLRNSTKFFLRSLRHPVLTREWLDTLFRPSLEPLWRQRPRMAQKLQRPYLACDLASEQKLAYLKFHYTALTRLLSGEALCSVYKDQLPVLNLRNESTRREIALRLCYRDQFEMEGDMTLCICDLSTGLTLATLSFSLCLHEGKRTLFIGGVQATQDVRIRENIHDVAKELYGLRPKALALWCLQRFASVWRLEQIVGVSDSLHVYRHSRKRALILSSYDEFWTESDGARQADGLWTLPLVPEQRPRAEIKASRRKQYERRYALLEGLGEALSGALELLAPSALEQRNHQARPPIFVYQSSPAASEVAADGQKHKAGAAAVGNPAAASSLAFGNDHSF